MSSIYVFANNASSLLASSITNSQTTVTVTTGQGALFPSIGAGQEAICTIEDVSGDIEIVYATGRTGDTLTILRAQEGTTALAFASGSRIEQRVTAGLLQSLLQKNGGDTMTGTTNMNGVLALGSGGSIQGGEFTGALRGAPGQTSNQVVVPSAGSSPATSGGSVILTAANIGANLASGTALILSQMIVAWAGSLGSIPAGFLICDGTNGTPNLTDVFIVGATENSVFPPSGTVTYSTATAVAGGTNTGTQLALNDLPSHLHPFDAYTSSGSNFIGIPGFSPSSNSPASSLVTGTKEAFAGSPNTGAGTNQHTHAFTGIAHAHNVNTPPYQALFWIMKS